MVPQRSKRDIVESADSNLAQARNIAENIAKPGRSFEDFARHDCADCHSDRACGMRRYDDYLKDAAEGYAAAGLGILADRVDAIRYSPPAQAWAAFDEANLRDDLGPAAATT
jgi:hypothetical protein